MTTLRLGEKDIPRLGMGTWDLGRTDEDAIRAEEALRIGVEECGLSLVDTAEMYGNEVLLGRILSPLRDKVYLVSKVLPMHADFRGTIAACENSLRRLKTDYLDLYLLHWKGPHPLRETISALQVLQAAGKIRSWGVSNFDTADMVNLPDGVRCAANQVLYNPEHRGIEYDLLPWMRRRGMPLMVYSPLGQSGSRLLRHAAVRQAAEQMGCSPAQLLLAWVLRQPGVMALAKASSSVHMRENAAALHLTLPESVLSLLETAFPAPSEKIPLASW